MPPLRGIEVRKFFKVLKNRVYCSVEGSPLCAPSTVLESLHTVLHVIITQTLPSRVFALLIEEIPKQVQQPPEAAETGSSSWRPQPQLCFFGSNTQPLGHPGTPTPVPTVGQVERAPGWGSVDLILVQLCCPLAGYFFLPQFPCVKMEIMIYSSFSWTEIKKS